MKLSRRLYISSLFLGFVVPAFALDPEQRISQYGHKSWRTQDGLFSAHPTAIAQTEDGYLWIGTKAGLLRFDGLQFVQWQTLSGDHLPSSEIMSLTAARD